MKPETRRLIILDVMLGCGGVLVFFQGISGWMWVPELVSLLVLLGYGFWLFARMWSQEKLPDEDNTAVSSVVVRDPKAQGKVARQGFEPWTK